MNRSRACLIASAVIVSAIMSVGITHAGTYTWDGGGADANWSSAGNWNPDGAPPTADTSTVINLAGSTRTDVTADAAYSIGQLKFDIGASAFTLSGQTIRLSGATVSGTTVGVFADGNNAVANTVNNNLQLLASMQLRASRNASLIFNGAIDNNGNLLKLYAAGNASVTIKGVISGSGGLNTDGSREIFLTGANSYTGATQIAAGILVVGHNQALGQSTGKVTLGFSSLTGSASLLISQDVTLARDINVSATSGTPIYTIGGYDTASGTIGAAGGSITLNGGQPLQLAANGTGVITIASNIAKAVDTGTDKITKTGTGTVILTGNNNTYGGSTEVTQGTLLVNGVLAAGGAVNVSPGASLGGSGTIQRTVNVQSGGILAPTGKLTVASLSLASDSVLNFEIGGPVQDEIVITGAGPTSLQGLLNISVAGDVTPGQYTLFSTTGGSTIDYTGLTVGPLGNGWSFDRTTGVLTVAAVPEPAALSMLALAGMTMLYKRR